MISNEDRTNAMASVFAPVTAIKPEEFKRVTGVGVILAGIMVAGWNAININLK